MSACANWRGIKRAMPASSCLAMATIWCSGRTSTTTANRSCRSHDFRSPTTSRRAKARGPGTTCVTAARARWRCSAHSVSHLQPWTEPLPPRVFAMFERARNGWGSISEDLAAGLDADTHDACGATPLWYAVRSLAAGSGAGAHRRRGRRRPTNRTVGAGRSLHDDPPRDRATGTNDGARSRIGRGGEPVASGLRWRHPVAPLGRTSRITSTRSWCVHSSAREPM